MAFEQSDTLALEITEFLDPAKLAGSAMRLMKYSTYMDGSTLDDRLTPQQVATLQARLKSHAGLPWNIAKKMRPWVVMGSLALPACELARKRAGKPFLDMKLGLDAMAAGKTIAALETLEHQMTIMASLPEPVMLRAMLDTAEMGDQLEDVFETMTALYQRGQTGLLWTMMRHMGPNGLDPENVASGYGEFHRVVVDERNVTMADAAEKLLSKGGAFIAVGALHLPGDNGILNILAHRGYEISRP